MSNQFLKISGNYEQWNVYRKSVIVCDVTEYFISNYLPIGSRTIDQMRQAARSCKQNIVEGVSDGCVSMEMCIRLIGVARGSLRELREDYGDYLRQHDYSVWSADDERTARTRAYCLNHYDPRAFVGECMKRSPETVANIMLTQARQLDAMLAGVLKKLQREFLAEGGIKEAMTRARLASRGRPGGSGG